VSQEGIPLFLRFNALGPVAQIPFRSAESLGLPSAMSSSALSSLPKGSAERSGRMELRIEDSQRSLLTLDGYPASPATFPQGDCLLWKIRDAPGRACVMKVG